jgi:hypothetical protein
MRIKLFFLVAFGLPVFRSLAQENMLSKSDMVTLDFHILAGKKQQLRSGDKALTPAYRQLLSDADKLLSFKPVSVMDKTDVPPSGDKHDYMSIAPYFWPDSSKPGGLPYVNRDGLVNPEVRKYTDKTNLPALSYDVYLLSLAYYYSGDEKYARHAATLIQVWFLDTATKMNPNLNYGQAVKGVTEGRSYGLIDSRFFIYIIDGIRLLQPSPAWGAARQTGMKAWFAQFLDWMQTNELGVDEMNAKNNHGVWYDAQRLSMALFLDSTDLANRIVARAASRLDEESDNRGFFPLELARTTSLHYSVFILHAFFIIAQLSEETKVHLWTLTTPTGKSLRKSFEAILPYLDKTQQWTGPQITQFNFNNAVPVLWRGITHYDCRVCLSAVRAVDSSDASLINLL